MKGFSLIELLVVLVILEILLLFVAITIVAQLQRARDGRRKLDFNLVRTGLEQYFDTANCYPATLPACDDPLMINKQVYLSGIPCDPKTHKAYAYYTSIASCSTWFKLYTNLERSDDPNINWSGCSFGCGPQCQYNFGISSPNIGLDRCTPTPSPSIKPSSAATPTRGPTNTPTPTPIQYVCGPASGPYPLGRCEPYAVPTLSECPKIYLNDPTCNYECWDKDNRCRNAKGKYKPSP